MSTTLLERLRTVVTTYKGDMATLQLLTECGEVLEAFHDATSRLREEMERQARGYDLTKVVNAAHRNEVAELKADFKWLEDHPDAIGRADRDHDDGRNWGVFAEPLATWHCTIREAIAYARKLEQTPRCDNCAPEFSECWNDGKLCRKKSMP